MAIERLWAEVIIGKVSGVLRPLRDFLAFRRERAEGLAIDRQVIAELAKNELARKIATAKESVPTWYDHRYSSGYDFWKPGPDYTS